METVRPLRQNGESLECRVCGSSEDGMELEIDGVSDEDDDDEEDDCKIRNHKKRQTAREGTQEPKSREFMTADSQQKTQKNKDSRTQSDRNPAGGPKNDKDDKDEEDDNKAVDKQGITWWGPPKKTEEAEEMPKHPSKRWVDEESSEAEA